MKHRSWRDRKNDVVHAGYVTDGFYEDDVRVTTACGMLIVFLHSQFQATRDPVDCMSCLVKEAS